MNVKDFFKNKIIGKTWLKVLSFCSVPFFIFMCLFEVEYLHYRIKDTMFYRWERNPLSVVFAFIVFAIISLVLLLFTKKLWIYGVCFGALTVIAGLINCIKAAANGDNFMPWDISMAGKLDQLVSFAKIDLPKYTFAGIAVISAFIVIFALSKAQIPVRWYIRVPGAAAIFSVFVMFYNMPELTEKVFRKFEMSFEDSILQSTNYNTNGFVSAFTINCFALKVVPPEGYGKEKIYEYLDAYIQDNTVNNGTAQKSEQPDIIVLMSEAFFDVRTLKGTEFSENPLKNFDRICQSQNSYSGKMYTTAFGGGTIRTEFETITGLTLDYLANGTSPYLYITKDTETYVSVLKNQGYTTTGIHPYDGSFYMRENAYPYLGFDSFITEDDLRDREDATRRRGYLTDDMLTNAVIDTLEQNSSAPNFIYAISMENHGAYDKSEPSEIIIDVQNDSLNQKMLDSVTTYTQGVYYTDRALGKLVDYIDKRDKETILLFFGDHLPTLGASYAAYTQAGNIKLSDGLNYEENKFLYSTPFVYYANYNVDYSVFGGNHDISCYYLLSFMAKIAGTQTTPYMEYLLDNFKHVPFYNTRLQAELDKAGSEFINSMRFMTYDRIKGKGYSVTDK